MMEFRIAADALGDFVRRILTAAGSRQDEALIVADHLVGANLTGHDSHGVGLIPTYLADVRAGRLKLNQRPERLADFGPILHFDAHFGFGHVAAREATGAAIERAREIGVAIAGLRNSHHIARVGTYGETISEAGFVGLTFANVHFGRQIVAPFGGADGRLHTNPICIAVPTEERAAPFVLDFATSRIALGKTRVAFNKQAEVSEGSLIDACGEPTTDPAVMFCEPFGALLPFGEHKGSGLALMCELIAGAMLGGPRNDAKDPPSQGLVNNLLAIVIDPARFGDPQRFRADVAAVLEHVKRSPAVAADAPVMTAGEPERATRRLRMAHGVPVDRRTYGELVEAAQALGVVPPATSSNF
jgi:uncharacterized oxidoreductase